VEHWPSDSERASSRAPQAAPGRTSRPSRTCSLERALSRRVDARPKERRIATLPDPSWRTFQIDEPVISSGAVARRVVVAGRRAAEGERVSYGFLLIRSASGARACSLVANGARVLVELEEVHSRRAGRVDGRVSYGRAALAC